MNARTGINSLHPAKVDSQLFGCFRSKLTDRAQRYNLNTDINQMPSLEMSLQSTQARQNLNHFKLRHGGKILADQLAIQQCKAVFCVAGESFLPALDGLYDHPEIQTVTCRHEGGAAIMAEAYGKMTGRPAVCFVTRGPGATNASLGAHIALQDSTPMVLMIGQVERSYLDREAFQEVDFRTMFRPLAKWVAQVEDPRRIPEYVSRAWATAMSGRQGPVVLVFPEDVLFQEVEVEDLLTVNVVEAIASEGTSEQVSSFFSGAKRPLVVVGGSGWSEECRVRLESFSERNNLPVAAEFRCQDYFDNRHQNYIGDLGISTGPGLESMMRESDAVLCIGARLGELPTQKYSLVQAPNPRSTLFHVHADIGELGRVYQPTVACNAASLSFIARLDDVELSNRNIWLDWTKQGRKYFLGHSSTAGSNSPELNDQVIEWLRNQVPSDTIVTSGSGISTGVLHRYYYYGARFRTQLAPIAGSMGYSLPAAISAKMCAPSQKVVCICGDGCFMMTAPELATAAQLNLDITVIVVNNGVLGTIRKHQEKHYPGRVVATDLQNPDFSLFAKSFGALGFTATSFAEFKEAFLNADSHKGLALIDLQLDRSTYVRSLMT